MQLQEQLLSPTRDLHYLTLLSRLYPTIQSVSTEIINLQAILDLPKGTEHFLSDLHGEYEAFLHILNNCSGVIREKVDMLYSNTVPLKDREELSTLIYYPDLKLQHLKKSISDLTEWYKLTLHRLIEICRLVASKYTRSKVRKALPKDFDYIIDELLHTNYDVHNKTRYYEQIISTIIDIERADAFIIAICSLIKRLAVDRLHIIGDIFDRGPRADVILDSLIRHHCVDIQWGNHDILWMGAAAGSDACIANVLNISLQYNNLDVIENGYGINLRQLTTFAQETYRHDPCKVFLPRVVDDNSGYDQTDLNLVAKIHKAIVVIQFKLEGQAILRHPEYQMQERLLLSNIDYEAGTVTIGGVCYPLRDTHFPTVDPKDPYALTEEEQTLVETLRGCFLRSEKLQRHVRFLFSKGGLYQIYNSNLLYHGCIPLCADGSFDTILLDGVARSGKKYMDYAESLARKGYFSHGRPKADGEDFMWYLWCGSKSPLFGRSHMTTFERYLIADESTWAETKNPYYSFTDDEEICTSILTEFGLDPQLSHIMNGHVPVKTKDGESPVKAGGKLIVIDGGFCKAYQPTTGIAGYTLIYNSYGLRLVSHEPFGSTLKAIEENRDIHSTTTVFERVSERRSVSATDDGTYIRQQIEELKDLLTAYRTGAIKENHHGE